VPAARHVPSNIARSSTPPRTASNTIASNTTAPNASLRKRRSSPALRAQRQLQGRYLGYMRQLTAKEKARFHAIKERDGFPAAITALKQHLRK
jgi:hypothetical protein